MRLRDALDRTLLLLRDEFPPSVDEAVLLGALTDMRVALIADERVATSSTAQTAFVTAAMLMARSGHQVYLRAPDVPLVGSQPPLKPGGMITSLLEAGIDMLPDVAFSAEALAGPVDLAIGLGNSSIDVPARRTIRLNADDWTGYISPPESGAEWGGSLWPLGALAAAGLAAGEAFKIALRSIRAHAGNPARFAAVFAENDALSFAIAPPGAKRGHDLGQLDCVSGGAIAHAALYVLSRIPGVTGRIRLFEPDLADLSNLNRYMLLLRSQLGHAKATDLTNVLSGCLQIEPIVARYGPDTAESFAPLAPSVLVGVDDIPSRWVVQRNCDGWLGVGATTHWSAMASFHERGLGCARCLHPVDDPGIAPIPTVAFVSFWAGLLTAAYLLRHVAGEAISPIEQQVFLSPLRAENPFRSTVHVRRLCPTCRSDAQRATAA